MPATASIWRWSAQFVDGLENLQTIGRNGLHRYNNQDHAMLTGMLAVRNATLGERNDLWSVNVDQEYHEEIRQAEALEVAVAEEAISEVFTRIDGVALGLAAGVTSGVLLLLATIALVRQRRRRLKPRPPEPVFPRIQRHPLAAVYSG